MTPQAQRGATTIEMTLVGIPLMFILISIFEISRGMWMYNTAATSVREGVRFASVHGVNCVQAAGVPNQCDITANDVVRVIRAGTGTGSTHSLDYGPTGAGAAGLDPVNTTVRFVSKTAAAFNCKLDGTSGGNCNAQWPPDPDNTVNSVITISIETPFSSALAMFWPGSKPVSFAVVNLWASSSDTMQF